MRQSNSRIIRFYKGVVLPQIHKYMVGIDSSQSLSKVDVELKKFAGYEGRSCNQQDMSNFEMQDLVEMSIFYFAELTESMGERIEIKYPSEKHE
jgi:hypothetical protein